MNNTDGLNSLRQELGQIFGQPQRRNKPTPKNIGWYIDEWGQIHTLFLLGKYISGGYFKKWERQALADEFDSRGWKWEMR